MDQIFQIMQGAWLKEALFVAARLNLLAILKEGPKHHSELATITNTNPEFLFRLLRMLVSTGIFKVDDHGNFSSTPLSDAGAENQGVILHLGEAATSNAWLKLEESVRTGKTGWSLSNPDPVFEFYNKNPQSLGYFQDAMTQISKAWSGFVPAFNFGQFNKIIDIGGGHGKLGYSIAKAHPTSSVTIFDLPKVIEVTNKAIETEYTDVAPRMSAVGGDFFKEVPSGGDLYVLKHILHDWDDESSVKILKTIHAAISENAKLLVLDIVVPKDLESPYGKRSTFIDVHMMIVTGGKERTEEQWKNLFDASGFVLDHIEVVEGQSMVFAKKK